MSIVENIQKKDMFYILLLQDGLVTVPKQWLTADKEYTFWPSNMNTAQCINLVKSCAEVNVQWKKYEIQFIYGTAETYKRAREKEKLAEKLSDVNTTSDEEENKRKRKFRNKKKFFSECEDSDDTISLPLPKTNKHVPVQLTYPKPASLKSVSASSVMNNMDHIETNKSDFDNESEEEIDENRKLNNSSPLKNINNFIENNLAYKCNKEAIEDKNFKIYVIKSLINITNRIKRCEVLLNKQQNTSSEQLENKVYDIDENNILDEKFPMKTLDDVTDTEQQLKHGEMFKKQLKSALYFRSQSTMKKTVTRFMTILFIDELAAKFSWTGQKENKEKFENLLLWKIIFGVIRSKFKDVSEGDVSTPLKIWLSHAQDRIKNKRQKTKEFS